MVRHTIAEKLDSDYVLVTDSQEVREILEISGHARLHNVYALFVLVLDGEYAEIWTSPRFVVYNDTLLTRIV